MECKYEFIANLKRIIYTYYFLFANAFAMVCRRFFLHPVSVTFVRTDDNFSYTMVWKYVICRVGRNHFARIRHGRNPFFAKHKRNFACTCFLVAILWDEIHEYMKRSVNDWWTGGRTDRRRWIHPHCSECNGTVRVVILANRLNILWFECRYNAIGIYLFSN